MKKELYPIQQTHLNILATALEKHRAALDASSTGCGKTLIAAELSSNSSIPTLVIGLKNTLSFWKTELQDRSCSVLDVINYENVRRGKSKWGKFLRKGIWQWNLPKDTLIIWDEVQRCQGLSSLNSQMLIAAKPHYNLMLSATAAEDPTEMRALGYILELHKISNFWKWCRANNCVPNMWGGLDFEGGPDEVDAIHKHIFPERGHRITTRDLADHFTETQIVMTPLDFGNDLKKIYKQMEKELGDLKEIMKSDSWNPNARPLIAMLRARQSVELCKVPAMIEMGHDMLREGRSVAFFVNFDATLNALIDRFSGEGHAVSQIHGGQSSSERDLEVQAFQNNAARVIVSNLKAGGVALSLHDESGKYPRVSIISPSWDAKEILQALGRIHRAGGQTPTQQHVLFAAGTIEEKVRSKCLDKMDNLQIFNEGQKSCCQD